MVQDNSQKDYQMDMAGWKKQQNNHNRKQEWKSSARDENYSFWWNQVQQKCKSLS